MVTVDASKVKPLEIDADQILDGKQVAKLLAEQSRTLLEQVESRLTGQGRATELGAYVDSFEVFGMESPLGMLGREALTARLAGIPSISTPEGYELAKAAVEDVARAIGEQQVAAGNGAGRRTAQGARTLRPGPGSGTATHVVVRPDRTLSEPERRTQEVRQVKGVIARVRQKYGI
jgi:hypothetical protein